MTRSEGDPGFTLHNGVDPEIPVLISVPHAGRDYPSEIFQQLRLPPSSLLRLEDRYADLLVRNAIATGMPVLVAHRARAWIDLNRGEQDVDGEMICGLDKSNLQAPGAKQRGGLGLIPRRLSGEGDIWKGQLQVTQLEARLATFHRPYHATLRDTLYAMRDRFGVAVLLDLHSMPPLGASHGSPPPRFVIGDRFGRSAGNRFSELLLSKIKADGYPATLNHPYAGDHILRIHGQPDRGIHAIQVEVDRSLYLDELLREPGAGVAPMSRFIAELVLQLADAATGSEFAIAAE